MGKRWTIALIAALSFTAFVATIQARDGAPRTTMSQGLQGGFSQTREDEYSSVIEEAPEPSDPQEREARRAKNIRYNTGGHDITILRPGVETFIEHAWPRNKVVPVAESAVIVTGTVIKVQPYLSDDRSNLYTEMTLQVENVLERDANNPVSAVNTLAIDWLGGALKLRSGRVVRDGPQVDGLGKPRIGKRYIVFAGRINNGGDIGLIKSYELRDGKVFTNDSQESKPISKWPGVPKAWASEGTFIEAVRQEVLLTEQMDSSTFYVNDVEVLTKYDSRYILRRTNQIFSSDIPSKKSDIDGLVAELKATGIYVDVQTELTPSRNKYSRKLLINAKNVEHIQEITISEVVLSGLPEVDNAEFQSALARRDITNNSYLSKHSFSELEGKISEALIEVYPNTAAEKEEMGTAWVTIRPDGEKRVKLIVSPEDLGSNVR